MVLLEHALDTTSHLTRARCALRPELKKRYHPAEVIVVAFVLTFLLPLSPPLKRAHIYVGIVVTRKLLFGVGCLPSLQVATIISQAFSHSKISQICTPIRNVSDAFGI